MKLFVYNQPQDNYETEINGVRFICKEISPAFEQTAVALADEYEKKLPRLITFIMDDITDMFRTMHFMESVLTDNREG